MASPRTLVERFRHAEPPREDDADLTCATCGSDGHPTSSCTGRDDLTFGTRIKPENGEYHGTARVRVLPPGHSFLDASTRRKPTDVERGQIWYSPDAVRHFVESVRRGVASMRRELPGKQFAHARVKCSTLRSRWFYAGKGAARG